MPKANCHSSLAQPSHLLSFFLKGGTKQLAKHRGDLVEQKKKASRERTRSTVACEGAVLVSGFAQSTQRCITAHLLEESAQTSLDSAILSCCGRSRRDDERHRASFVSRNNRRSAPSEMGSKLSKVAVAATRAVRSAFVVLLRAPCSGGSCLDERQTSDVQLAVVGSLRGWRCRLSTVRRCVSARYSPARGW